MKNYLLTIIVLLLAVSANAQKFRRSGLYDLVGKAKQNSAIVFNNVSVFSPSSVLINNVKGIVSNAVNISIDKPSVMNVFKSKPKAIIFSIPAGNNKSYKLDLVQQLINTVGDFSFGTFDKTGKRTAISIDQGLHYRGYIDGDSSSIASISVFANGEVTGMFSGIEGDFNIGKTDTSTTSYVLYNSKDMEMPQGFSCGAQDTYADAGSTSTTNIPLGTDAAPPPQLCKKVRFYWEANYGLYNTNFKANIVSTENYLAALFNQVATMYQNEGIVVELAEVNIWTSADPYRSDNSGDALDDFQKRWNDLGDSFNGDIAHLIAGGTTNNGGIAYLLSSLCFRGSAYGYSNVKTSYKSFPTYSWDVNVVTHEIGHNLGAHHTHWCGWNTGSGGTCGAIDNCYTLESGNSCTSCPVLTDTATRPVGWKGTVMSYCHLNSKIGIDLANGFGPLPQAVIRNTVSNSACLKGVEIWTGTTDSAWEKAANWSCPAIPNAGTDVTIPQGAPNYPVINSSAQCHSLTQAPSTSVKVNTGHSLNITGVKTVYLP